MKKSVITFILTLLWLYSLPQQIDKVLNNWSAINPVEKVYVQTDRDNYFAGQTIWMKGYFMSEFMPSIRNSTLYVELLNNVQEIVLREVFPVYAGISQGQLDLPDTLTSGVYQLRAYSPLMLNQPGFTFSKSVSISGIESKVSAKSKAPTKNRLDFFPEGGNFVTGIQNRVAFKSTDMFGTPIDVEGEVRNSKEELVVSFKSQHDGMGAFFITPLKGEVYHAIVKGSSREYDLPLQVENGISFQVTSHPDRKEFKIVCGTDKDVFRPAYLVGQIQNHVIFKQSLESNKEEMTGFIKTTDLYSGILHLTVFNKDDMPLAERITFVDNREYIIPADLKIDTLDTGKRKRNHFTIALSDTVIGNFSVSVTDADFENENERPVNIYASFLLNSDIRGYVHNPAWYFNNNSDSTHDALELVMMTNGWTRFTWTELATNKLPQVKYKDDGYIGLNGRVFLEGRRKPLADKDVIFFVSPYDSSSIIRGMSRIFHTDSAGYFKADSLFFYGKMKMLFSEVRGKKNNFINVVLDGDSLHRLYPVELQPWPVQKPINATTVADKMDLDYKQFMHERGIVLENVVVRAKQKTELEKLDEEYSSGFFSGNIFSRKLDLRKEIYGGNIFDYLRERIPGLQIAGEPGNYVLNYRGGDLTYYTDGAQVDGGDAQPTTNNGNVTLFLNEMQTNVIALESLGLNEIALVKLFPTSVMAPGGGAVLAVYTKKEKDLTTPNYSPTDMLVYNGYSIVKEFHNPVYDRDSGNGQSDSRVTLGWFPDVSVSGVNPQIPVTFFNNDRTKRFKIVAEGITVDGQMLMLEKIVEASAR